VRLVVEEEVAVLVRPDRESGVFVLSGEPGAFEQDRQERQSHRIALARGDCAGSRPEAAQALPGGRQLPEVVADLVGERDETPGTLAARKLDITPQVLQDTDKV
jgi:hypothetical protein